MTAMLMKYTTNSGEYLVMDTCSNSLQMDGHAARAICSRNFGVGSRGILVGNVSGNAQEMEWFDPQGVRTELNTEAMDVARCCVLDTRQAHSDWSAAGGESAGSHRPYLTGKIFLTEKFINSNHLCRAMA